MIQQGGRISSEIGEANGSADSEAKARSFLELQYSIAAIISSAASEQQACADAIRAICAALHFKWGAFWLREDSRLRLSESQQAASGLDGFATVSHTLDFAKGEGLPGKVWAENGPVWIPDFSRDGTLPRKTVAGRCGLHAALAFPVKGQEFIGVMEFISEEILPPDSKLLQMMSAVGAQLGQFIERKRAELALAESQSLFLSVFNSALDTILLANDFGEIIEANPAATKTLGYSRASLLRRKVWSIFPKSAAGDAEELWKQFIKTGEQNGEITLQRHDGSSIEVDYRAVAKIVPGVHLAILRDITGRKHRERRTRLLAEAGVILGEGLNYAATLQRVARLATPEFADCTMIDVENDLHELERIEVAHCDPEIEGSLKKLRKRLTVDDVSAKSVATTGETLFLPRIPEQVLKAEDDEQSRALKKLRPTSAIVTPLRAQGRFFGSITFVRSSGRESFTKLDVELADELARRAGWAIDNARLYQAAREELRLREKVEQALKKLNHELEERIQERTAALRESNSQMEAFCYSVSHDLRAPLRSMQGFSRALLDDYCEVLPQEGRDFAKRIVAASEHMDGLLADVLAYSRLTRQELKPEKVELAAVVEDVRVQLMAEIRRRNANIDARVEGAVRGNRAVLELILMNLVENALKFVPRERVPTVRIETERRGERCRIWVRDNGIGIAPEHHQRIFRIFERLHGVESYPGTGIGLALVQKAAERMGGSCGVDSMPGQGSAFWIELPGAFE